MRYGRGVRRGAALIATGGVLIAGAAGCNGGSDDAGGGDDSSGVEQSDGGGTDGAAGTDDGSGASDSGGTSDGGSAGEDGGSSDDAAEYGPDTDLRTDGPPVTAEDAVSTGQDTVGDGTLHAVELDYDEDDAAWQWDVKILAGDTDHKVIIDAVTGEVVADETETTDDREKAVDLNDPMTFQEADDLASAEVDGPLRGWKLEHDDGMVQYQFDIDAGGDEQEVTVDAETGDVTVD